MMMMTMMMDDDEWKMSDGSQSPYTIILKCDCGVYYMSWYMIRCMMGHDVAYAGT